MAGRGWLSRLGAMLERVVLRREVMGRDSFGNKYYRKFEKNEFDDGMKERRWVKPLGGEYDPATIPPEWFRWLNRTRDAAPTDQDIATASARKLVMQQRVAALEAEEEKRRYQAESLGMHRQSASGPDVDRFLQQLSDKGYGGDQVPSPGTGSQGGEFKPETWTPPGPKPGGS